MNARAVTLMPTSAPLKAQAAKLAARFGISNLQLIS